VRLAFRANSREEYESAHAALRDHPEVKWTL
jgi:putative lipoic acid-binding regulatory protein